MRAVLLADDRPGYPDAIAAALLAEGRAAFAGMGLARRSLVEIDDRVLLFPWVGSRKLFTLALALNQLGIRTRLEGLALEIDDADPADIRQALVDLSTAPPPDLLALTRLVPDKTADTYDALIDDALLTEAYARSLIEAGAVPRMAEVLLIDLSGGWGDENPPPAHARTVLAHTGVRCRRRRAPPRRICTVPGLGPTQKI